MEPDHLAQLVRTHLNTEFEKLHSQNTLAITELHSGKWWVTDPTHWNYTAGTMAVEKVFGVKPDLTREGGSIPVTLTFQDALGKNVLLLPMGRGNDGAHSTNEKLDLSNFISGTKLLGAYLHEIAQIKS